MGVYNLDQKYAIERDFHESWARSIDVDKLCVYESFEAETSPENKIILQYWGDLRNKRVLDLGCGAGEASVYFALKGAEVHSVDISSEMLKTAQKLSERHKVKIKTYCVVAENIDFPDGFFDYIYGANILHHSDPLITIRQAARVLKEDGKACFIEPLKHNPAINVYRKLAHKVCTPTEKPFGLKDLQFVRDYFSGVEFKFFWLSSLSIFIYMYFIERLDPSKERYWKRVVQEHSRYDLWFSRLNKFDDKFLKIFPFMRYWCWNAVMLLDRKKL